MKKLHKKLSALALASMMVIGGVASSGVQSHAASSSKVKQQILFEKDDKFVEEVCKSLDIEILIKEKSSAGMEKRIKDVFRGRHDIISVLIDGGKVFKRGERKKFKSYLQQYVKDLEKDAKGKQGKQNRFLRVRFGSRGYILDFNEK